MLLLLACAHVPPTPPSDPLPMADPRGVEEPEPVMIRERTGPPEHCPTDCELHRFLDAAIAETDPERRAELLLRAVVRLEQIAKELDTFDDATATRTRERSDRVGAWLLREHSGTPAAETYRRWLAERTAQP